jgi:WS/DGAT/MGAT family acyltransferase
MPDFSLPMSQDERLGVFDAVMWNVERDPVLRSVIIAMVVLDQDPDLEVLRSRIDAMTRFVPKLQQRVVGNQNSLVPPRWEQDPHYDLDYHVRRLAVRDDGTLRPALAVAETMAEQDFDRKRPLWEIAVVSGLTGGQSAVIVKIHHAITDGVGGMAMAATLFDLGREPRTDLGAIPDTPELAARSPLGRILSAASYEAGETLGRLRSATGGAVGLAKDAVSDPLGAAGRSRAWVSSAGRLLAPADEPVSPVMTGRSLSVHFETFDIPLAGLKASARAAGATLNDAFVAAVAGGLRRYHEHHGQVPEAVRINMPVNTRTAGDNGGGGNRWVPARFLLPIDEADAAARLEALSPLLKQARTEPALALSDHVYRLLTRLPATVATNVSAGLMKGTDVAATNVPGPPIPIYAAGAEVLHMLAFAPKGGAAVNVAMLSYRGLVEISVNMDLAAIRDPDVMMRCLREGFDEVLAVGDA